jgi:uncharacterized Zn finger protein (UPF0148 family)
MTEQYFVKRGETVKGPFSVKKLQELLAAKQFKANDLIGMSDDGPWERVAAARKHIQSSAVTQNTSSESVCSECGQPLTDLTRKMCPRCLASLPSMIKEPAVGDDKADSVECLVDDSRTPAQQEIPQLQSPQAQKAEYRDSVILKGTCPHCSLTLTINEHEATIPSHYCPDCSREFTVGESAQQFVSLVRQEMDAEAAETEEDKLRKQGEQMRQAKAARKAEEEEEETEKKVNESHRIASQRRKLESLSIESLEAGVAESETLFPETTKVIESLKQFAYFAAVLCGLSILGGLWMAARERSLTALFSGLSVGFMWSMASALFLALAVIVKLLRSIEQSSRQQQALSAMSLEESDN